MCVCEALELELPSPLSKAVIPRFCVSGSEIKDSFFGSLKNIAFAEDVFLPWFSRKTLMPISYLVQGALFLPFVIKAK